MLTRRAYALIAKVLRDADYLSPSDRVELRLDFSAALQADNPRFGADRFRLACQYARTPITAADIAADLKEQSR